MDKCSGPDEETALNDLLALTPAADRARLAGIGMARRLMPARAVQLAREALIARSRFGADDPRTVAIARKAERHAVRIARFETEFEGAQTETPVQTPDATVIHGRVTEKGRGRSGVTVSARGLQGDVRGFACTDRVGGFSMSVPGEGTVRLRVTDKQGAVLHSGSEDIAVAPGRVVFREIRLGETPPDICTAPPDDAPDDGQPRLVKVPDLIGRTEAEAVRLLAALDLMAGAREEVEAPDSAGRVIKQKPEANAEVAPGTEVAIVVGARTDRPVPEFIGMPLDEARVALDKTGLTLGRIELVVDERRQNRVLKQNPAAGTRVEKGAAVALVVARSATPSDPNLVFALAAADTRFPSLHMREEELHGAAERLGLHDRKAIEALLEMPDDKLRETFALSALRSAQTLKRILREALARTA